MARLRHSVHDVTVLRRVVSFEFSLYTMLYFTATLESKGVLPIRQILQMVGLPPDPPTNSTDENFDWLLTVARTRRLLGVSMLIGMNVAEDVRNSSVNKIVVSINRLLPDIYRR